MPNFVRFALFGSHKGKGCACLGSSARPRRRARVQVASYRIDPLPGKIRLISWSSMSLVSDIKLIRTDTTIDLSQKAEKGMNDILQPDCLYTAPTNVFRPQYGIKPIPLCCPGLRPLVYFGSFARLFFYVFITRVTDQPISLLFPDLSWISLSLPNGLGGKMDLFLRTTIKSQLKWLILNSLIDFFWWTNLRLFTLIDSFEICFMPLSNKLCNLSLVTFEVLEIFMTTLLAIDFQIWQAYECGLVWNPKQMGVMAEELCLVSLWW